MLHIKSHYRAVYFAACILVFIACLLSSCDKWKCRDGKHKYFTIANNSSISVNWVRENSHDSVWTNEGNPYPANENDGLINSGSSFNEEFGSPRGLICVEDRFSPEGYAYYFFYNHDTVRAIGWEQISGTNRGLLKKVKVDLEYLKNNNFSITNP